ncbi:MAG TPA: flagellar hook capping FlgD N-terminal domain-containing protein [Caulobacteraceae bacterium]|jgi:flagellar basal-body rod modification protein FlgD
MTAPVTNSNPAIPPNTNTANGAAKTSSASTNQLSVNNGIASLADNFQSFLSLLTTQLQNQDPLNPTDTNQFTSQITQMTGVEQQLISNQLMQQLVSAQGGVTSAANLIGDTITAQNPASTSSTALSPISGVVTSVTSLNGETMLNVGDSQVPLSAVTSVTGVSNPLSSLLGSGA